MDDDDQDNQGDHDHDKDKDNQDNDDDEDSCLLGWTWLIRGCQRIKGGADFSLLLDTLCSAKLSTLTIKYKDTVYFADTIRYETPYIHFANKVGCLDITCATV